VRPRHDHGMTGASSRSNPPRRSCGPSALNDGVVLTIAEDARLPALESLPVSPRVERAAAGYRSARRALLDSVVACSRMKAWTSSTSHEQPTLVMCSCSHGPRDEGVSAMRGFLKLAVDRQKLYVREPVATFFTLAFRRSLVVLFGSIFGNEPPRDGRLRAMDM